MNQWQGNSQIDRLGSQWTQVQELYQVKGALEGFKGIRKQHQVNEFTVYNSTLQVKGDVLLEKSINTNWLQFHFQLKGISKTTKFESRQSFIALPQCFYLKYVPADYCQLQFKENTDYESFGFRMTPEDFLDSFLPNFEELNQLTQAIEQQQAYSLSGKGIPLTQTLREIILQMKNCGYTGQLRALFMESKMTDLVFAMVQQVQAQHAFANPTIDSKAKVKSAYEFMRHHLDDKLSIKRIAREVGLNEFALKKGFKEVFGTSVIQCLIDLRLDKAYEQMLSTHKSISTIAYETGYSAVGNFSNAFYKKFGFRPSVLRNGGEAFGV
ncbi:hypothetical protein BKI52_15405 [marine bacterium AO1-C]|nr:hypothetical protein BKI52_15405 [marine bacterium AO1-C]